MPKGQFQIWREFKAAIKDLPLSLYVLRFNFPIRQAEVMTSTSHEQLGDEDASILPARIVQVLIRLVINPFEIVF